MDSLSQLISAAASLAWPALFFGLFYYLLEPIKKLIASASGRRFTIKVAGSELTMEEASKLQNDALNDVQTKIAEIENRLNANISNPIDSNTSSDNFRKRILWVDDSPKNNSLLVQNLERMGAKVDLALSTSEALDFFSKFSYDIVISDMGRPEGNQAGIDLAIKLRSTEPSIPIFIFCGQWASRNLREAAISAGVTEITSSGSSLLSYILNL